MHREIGDVVIFSFISEYRGLVEVEATIIDIYYSSYGADLFTEMSIRYDHFGDTITQHAVPIDSSTIK